MPRVPRPDVSASLAPLTNLVQLFLEPATPTSTPAHIAHVELLTEWMSLGAGMTPAQLTVALRGARKAAALTVCA